ncbi:MAG: RNA polymerase sigma factor [SAR324 cluster bacterium]|nr:RNA polymerase sigma factor [SAR324 cluster bacterium]
MSHETELTLSDYDLIKRIALNDHSALDVLVNRYQNHVYRFLVSLTGNETLAEEALQETFIALWRSAQSFQGTGSVRAWIFQIARNAISRQYRLRKDEPHDFVSLDELGQQAGWGQEPMQDNMDDLKEKRELLEVAMNALAPEDREILILRDLNGLTGDETAELLQMSLQAVKSRLHRARLRLMKHMREVQS